MFTINRPLKNGTTVSYENKIGIIIGSKKMAEDGVKKQKCGIHIIQMNY